MAVGAVVYDGLVWWSEGVLRLLPLGELWSRLDLDSMNRAQSAVQRHLSVGLWNWVALPILRLPALPMFVIAGTIFLWLGRRIGSRAEASFIGSRPPRRPGPRRRLLFGPGQLGGKGLKGMVGGGGAPNGKKRRQNLFYWPRAFSTP